MNHNATNEKSCHGLPASLFSFGGLGGGERGFFSSYVWCGEWTVHGALSTWTVDCGQLTFHESFSHGAFWGALIVFLN